jgi:cell division protein FtsL
MKKYQFIIKTLVILVLLLGGARVVVSNSISTSGIALGEINEEISEYKLKNDILSEKLLTLSSLTAIASEAAKLGFTYKSESYVLTNPIPIAVRQ